MTGIIHYLTSYVEIISGPPFDSAVYKVGSRDLPISAGISGFRAYYLQSSWRFAY